MQPRNYTIIQIHHLLLPAITIFRVKEISRFDIINLIENTCISAQRMRILYVFIPLFESQNSELEESASEYLSAGCHDEHNCALKTNTDIDDYDDDKHSTTSTKLEDEEGSVRVQLPPVRRSQQAFFRRNGNNSTDHQLFSRRKRQYFIDIFYAKSLGKISTTLFSSNHFQFKRKILSQINKQEKK